MIKGMSRFFSGKSRCVILNGEYKGNVPMFESAIRISVQFVQKLWKLLLNRPERLLLNVSQTSLLLNKLQELSMAKLRPDVVEADLPPQALTSARLALATNLGRATLEE
ncbi:hypothetical protein DVH24_020840 [Malus domestica]|uniref:Uncharacterized protein n=1 Tax=Malus domestica TaxID=3750 RepID=A0A498JAM4_MALDO|nr:hypothetical protein DVH24_020840 [Malus domestica]